MDFLVAFAISFFGSFIAMPLVLFWVRALGFYVVVRERECVVFELFGKVRLTISEPGLHFPWMTMGPFAALVPVFGRRR